MLSAANKKIVQNQSAALQDCEKKIALFLNLLKKKEKAFLLALYSADERLPCVHPLDQQIPQTDTLDNGKRLQMIEHSRSLKPSSGDFELLKIRQKTWHPALGKHLP